MNVAKQATRESIKHWMKDIIQPLRKGDTILRITDEYGGGTLEGEASNKLVLFFSISCPLFPTFADCSDCPIKIDCNDPGSPWLEFYTNPNLENANQMVKLLVQVYRSITSTLMSQQRSINGLSLT